MPGQPETRIEGKRRVYAHGGPPVHIEVDSLGDLPTATWYALTDAGVFEVAGSATGQETLRINGKYPFSVVPSELDGWFLRYVERLEDEMEQHRRRAERAEEELQRLQSGK